MGIVYAGDVISHSCQILEPDSSVLEISIYKEDRILIVVVVVFFFFDFLIMCLCLGLGVNTGCLHQLLSTLFFETGSQLGVYRLIKLAGQPAPGPFCLPSL